MRLKRRRTEENEERLQGWRARRGLYPFSEPEIYDRDEYFGSHQLDDRFSSPDIATSRTHRKLKRVRGHQPKLRTNPLTVQCFYTSIAIDLADGDCVVVTRVLLDSGAGAHFIHRRLVNELGLGTCACTPQPFETATGEENVCSEYCELEIWLGGVQRMLTAMVDDSKSNALFTLGEPTWNDFLLSKSTIHTDSERIQSVTVAWDVEGCRKDRFVVEEDTSRFSGVQYLARDHHLAKRAREGTTIEEVAARKQGDEVRSRVNLALLEARFSKQY